MSMIYPSRGGDEGGGGWSGGGGGYNWHSKPLLE